VAWGDHDGCFVCGAANLEGLRLAFEVREDRSVAATFHCAPALRSYEGTLHGGVIAAVLDAAMTNALFVNGVAGVTAELTVRYVAPTRVERMATARASVVEVRAHGLYVLRAELEQDGRVTARASARFLERARTGRAAPDPGPFARGPHPRP
jgi:uncharacterized protein (TIGR00369 family)